MVELLAVIAILGVLAVIGIASVRGILGRSKTSYLDSQSKMVALAGKSYFSDHRTKLPKMIGPKSEVSLEDLIQYKYIDPVKDADGNECNLDKKSKVVVQKVSEEEYKYWVYLSCNGETSGAYEENPPTVSLNPTKTEGKRKTPLNVTLTVTDDTEVLSYRYTIYKDDKEYKSVSKLYKKPVSIRLDETGKYTIKASAYDIYGNRGETQGGIYEIEIADPDCTTFKVNAVPNATSWQKENILFTVTSESPTIATWSLEDKYTDNATKRITNKNLAKKTTSTKKTFTLKDNGTHELKIKGYNSAGKSCTVKQIYTYKIDKEKPKQPTLTGNPGKWTNKSFKLTGTTVEKYSGVAYWEYSYDQKDWTKYANSEKEKFTTTNFSKDRNQYVYIRVHDKAGNTSATSKSKIQIDKTPPTKPVLSGNPGWTRNNFKLTGTTTETGSGVSYWEYSYDKKTWKKYENSSKNKFVTTEFSKERNQDVYIRVVDKVGNKSEIASSHIQIDKTAPTSPKLSGNPGGWTNKRFRLSGTTVENGSGVSAWQYSYDKKNWKDYANSQTNSFKMPTFNEDMNKTIYIRVVDKVGNYSNVSNSKIMIDTVKPTLPTLSGNPNKWTNQNFKLTGSTTENGSGVLRWEYSYDQNKWERYESSSKTKFTTTAFSKERNQNVYIRVIDYAGNISPSASSLIRIDKTAPAKPVLAVTEGRVNTWVNTNVAFTGTTSDNLSGFNRFEYCYDGTSWNQQKYANPETYFFSVNFNSIVYVRAVDNAGNISGVASTGVSIDKAPPTCSSSGGSVTGNFGLVTGSCSDTGGSGCMQALVTKTVTASGSYSPGTVYDNAGNSVVCPNAQFTLTKPTTPTTPTTPEKPKEETKTVKVTSNVTKWNISTERPCSDAQVQCKTACGSVSAKKDKAKCLKDYCSSPSSKAYKKKNYDAIISGSSGCFKTDGKYGNVVGKVATSVSGDTLTVNWRIFQGKYTFIQKSYYVKLVLTQGDNVKFSKTLKEPQGSDWGNGTGVVQNHGSWTKKFSCKEAGTYRLKTIGNTTDPGFRMDFGTIKVTCS